MAEEEMEKFEITEYDLENEFNINRPVKYLTKHQQIYGIWADESDEEGGGGSSRPSFKGAATRQSYSTPVSFVAGGVHQAGKKKEEEKKESKVEEEEEKDNEGPVVISSSEEEEDEKPRPSFKNFSKGAVVEGEIAGLRKRTINTALINKGVGDWERHTKGIGAKLLLQMGYQPGRGLGKDLQGISAPIEAHQRKGRGAIGAYGSEKGQKIASLKPDSDEEEAAEFTEKLSQWRKGEGAKSKKVKYLYKSVDDVIEQGKTKPMKKDYSHLTKVKVIDMTGPEQRVLSGYHAIAGQQRPSDEWEIRKEKKFQNFALPELLHNLDILVDMCEQDIIQNDKKLNYANDRIVALEQEEESLTKLVEQEGKQIATFERVLEIIEEMVNKSKDKDEPLTLEKAVQSFKELQDNYYEEYKLYDLGSLASILVAPIFKEHLKDWDVLQEPKKPLDLFKQWKDLLEMNDSHTITTGVTEDPYHKLIWEAWMPSVRAAVNGWSCRKYEQMIEFLEYWLPLIPGWVLNVVCDQLVLPRIQREVEEWNPLTDTVPIHAWLHPWLPLLGNRLETVYPIIRHKLTNALVNWHPSDRSARLMLLPWHKVFSKADMDAFLIKNILPKLQLAMQEFIINPHQQHLDQWNWVMEWEDLLPTPCMVNLLEKFFFPKWLQILTMWLNHSPNYDEITNWYMGWKSMLSEKLLAEPIVKEQFRKALDLMNRAVSTPGQPLSQQPGAVESVSYLTNIECNQQQVRRERERDRESRLEMLAEAVRTASQIPQGFKELVQKRCEERGIVFVPMPNRWREGKQIYRCGKVQIYIDRSVIFMFQNGTWVPTSLQSILDSAA